MISVGPGPCIAVSPQCLRDLLEFGNARSDFVVNHIRVRRAPIAVGAVVRMDAVRGLPYRLACFVIRERPGKEVEVALEK